jgi:hypothetical protein
MAWAFDLSSYDEVKEHARAILERLGDGSMSCDGEWSEDQVGRPGRTFPSVDRDRDARVAPARLVTRRAARADRGLSLTGRVKGAASHSQELPSRVVRGRAPDVPIGRASRRSTVAFCACVRCVEVERDAGTSRTQGRSARITVAGSFATFFTSGDAG